PAARGSWDRPSAGLPTRPVPAAGRLPPTTRPPAHPGPVAFAVVETGCGPDSVLQGAARPATSQTGARPLHGADDRPGAPAPAWPVSFQGDRCAQTAAPAGGAQ